MVFGMTGERVTQTLRDLRRSIISKQSNGTWRLLTTLSELVYNSRGYWGHSKYSSRQLVSVTLAVKLAPLNIKNGHYPNLQRFPDA